MHHAARCPPATTTITSCHCPPAQFPTTTLYYATSLDLRHLICLPITAGGCVERCANCSPSNHAWRDSLCRCRPRHLAQRVGDNNWNIDFLRGNYRDKDMPQYDLTIAIFDTIRYIVPSLVVATITNHARLLPALRTTAPSCNVQLSYYRRQLQTGYQNFWSETVFADFL